MVNTIHLPSMSGKQFFADRYRKLGWTFKNVKVRQAIRLNLANSKGKELPQRLQNLGVNLIKIPFLETGYWVGKSKVSAGATAEYLLGLYSIQEAAAQIPATLFTNIKNKTVLDACAAPGGKTVQMADIMCNTGIIVALDINVRRLTALSNQLERCNTKSAIVYKMDARKATELNLKFDRILLDVPCSGNFASDSQWFNRRTIEDVRRNAKIQRQILSEAVKCLSPNGEIVYSTCSLEPEENELNIDWAIKNLNLRIDVTKAPGDNGVIDVFGRRLADSVAWCRRIWPGDTQGFFVCKLKRQVKIV